MVDWAYVCGMADDTGNNPDHDERQEPQDLTGSKPSDAYHPVYGHTVSCNRCGAKGLFWKKVRGRHLVFDKSTNEQHVCQPSADGFDEV